MKKTAFAAILLLHLAACSQTSNPKQQQDASITATPADITTAASLHNPDSCQSNAPIFAPPTEPIKDASLQAYLRELELAVQQQDASKLLTLLDPNIATGFDGSGGLEGFKERWNPAAKGSELWPLLHQMLELGGTPMQQGDSSNFALPYVYSAWPDSLDAFTYSAVVHDGAILRAEPAVSAAAVCALGRVILKVDYSKSYPQQDTVREKEWWYVASPDGQLRGYLHKSDLYSPVGYRAIFNKNKQGQWLMTALVSGD
ncbi:hypothetical protein I2I11_01925 [Pontibacter sp. 172403-2]|uniref:hypothetical protein n=1 Tax=Pontibacter rufus TaxID=2791028 RepID=UPI0018AF5844|nr:hypothetical protein [Pontibacter sp. 172403-2]MBF9252043.1 hypothetical protein [Pontibacter sp. 172403-2]